MKHEVVKRVGGEAVDTLVLYAQHTLCIVFGLLPLFFIPTRVAPFEMGKILFAGVGLMLALVLYSLSALKSGRIAMRISIPRIALWGVAGVSVISAFFSGDLKDALIGDMLGIHTALFLVFLALTVSVWSLVRLSKVVIMRFYMLLGLSTLILAVYHGLRLFWGPQFLSFSVFSSASTSPVGTWNDLALFLGLSVILSLVALTQLTLTKLGRALFGVLILLSLVLLAVINFFMVWVVLALSSLAMIIYALRSPRHNPSQLPLGLGLKRRTPSLFFAIIVCIASVIFIAQGSVVGGFISSYTKVPYVEVRPSFEATVDIAKAVYEKQPYLGIGTNKFSDAWRLYKDPSINSTIFWNTAFNAGSGYVPTFFVTNGIVGGIAWLLFLVAFVFAALRFVLNSGTLDPVWYFIGVSSFVSALYVWGMALLYVPGAVVLFLGAVCTAIALTASEVRIPCSVYTFSSDEHRAVYFVRTAIAILVVCVSVGSVYVIGKQYASAYVYVSGLALLETHDTSGAVARIQRANELFESDVYLRSLVDYKTARIQEIASHSEGSGADQAAFESAFADGLAYAKRATRVDSSDPYNWQRLGIMYGLLVPTVNEEAYELAKDAYEKAVALSPLDPVVVLDKAVIEGKMGHYDEARMFSKRAIALKPNFTDAYHLLSQIEVVSGNTDAAVASARSLITLEPGNPSRYYQLGILLASQKKIDDAIVVFQKSISLDPDFANAHYLLALAYDAKGKKGIAQQELEKVLALNPGNAEIKLLLDKLKKGEDIGDTLASISTLDSAPKNKEDDNAPTSPDEASRDSRYITPVNTIPQSAPSKPESNTNNGTTTISDTE